MSTLGRLDVTASRERRRRWRRWAWLVVLIAGCARPAWERAPHDRLFQSAEPGRLHAEPKEIEPSEWWESVYNGSFGQIGGLASPGNHAQNLFAYETALDVNAFGQVPDSTWFENRITRKPMTIDEVRRGPNRSDGPAPGKLVVKSGKTDGVTPGLVVKDSAGSGWVVKFDPPAYPELTSAAEVISTRLLHAAGYHVPENYVVRFHLDRLELSPKAKVEDDYGREVPFTAARLKNTLALLNPEADGRVRAMFSRYLPGKPIGPFPLRGTRLDDPNDRIPHERRRSLRGLWVFYAWTNNTDAKMANSLDVFLRDEKRSPELGYVKHYLIDFGTTLGASPDGPKAMTEGFEYVTDWERILGRLLAAGIDYPYWATAKRTPLRSVGQFESQIFDPAKWRPMHPYTPFERADADDTFWAASILCRFDPVTIAAAVSAGEYSEPAASAWVTYTLIERRDKLLRHAFRNFAPLDTPAVEAGDSVVLVDLEVLSGLSGGNALEYPWRLTWHRAGREVGVAAGVARHPRAALGAVRPALLERYGSRPLAEYPFFTLEMGRRLRGSTPSSSPRAHVHLRALADGTWIAVGSSRVSG